MLRKSMLALLVLATAGLTATTASARAGHRGVHGVVMPDGFRVHDPLPFGTAPGLYPPYAYGFPYYGPDAFPYDYEYVDDSTGCAIVQRLVHTRHGTWFHPVQVCG